MGTRGLMAFRCDGVDKGAYNHWDSYPSGLGAKLVDFVRQHVVGHLEDVRQSVRSLTVIADGHNVPTEEQVRQLQEFADDNVSSGKRTEWYCLLRKCQGDPENTLVSGYILDGMNFIYDSLFCEWAYVINLDELLFEVYKGWQHNPHSKGRYADMETQGKEYYPCALVAAFPLLDIPQDWVAAVDPEEEEDA